MAEAGLPPAYWKEPPAYTSVPDTASGVGQTWPHRRPKTPVKFRDVIDHGAAGGRETASHVKSGALHRQRVYIAAHSSDDAEPISAVPSGDVRPGIAPHERKAASRI